MRPESGKIKRSRRILVNRLSQPKERKQIVGYIILCDGQSLFRDQQFGIHVIQCHIVKKTLLQTAFSKIYPTTG